MAGRVDPGAAAAQLAAQAAADPVDPMAIAATVPRLTDDNAFTWSCRAMAALTTAGVPWPVASQTVQTAWSPERSPAVAAGAPLVGYRATG